MTLILNTLTGAVSEYTRHAFHAVTPTHGGSALGLFAFGGDTDDGLPIDATIRLPATLRESTLKKHIAAVYVSIQGAGIGRLSVHGAQQDWTYDYAIRPSGQSRCEVGRGIRENYLGLSLGNTNGAAFTLDRVEVLTVASNTRRI